MRALPSRLRPLVLRPSLGLVLLGLTSCIEASPWDERHPPPAAAKADGPVTAAPRVATAPANGFNDAIAWRGLDEGLREAKADHRPLMLVVHASWCGQCKALKPKFQDARISELSEQFVMVNADQDLVTQVQSYGPDGIYLPRVLFFDPETGQPDADLQNPARSRYHYYYGPRDDLAGMMEKALARHGKS
ncbi:MAG: thioredoxin family protein [Nannocystaceae bacterium]